MKQDTSHSQSIDAWFLTNQGQRVLALEHKQMKQLLEARFGFHLLQIGLTNELAFWAGSKVPHHINLAHFPQSTSLPSVYGVAEALPFESDSIDVCIIHHALEFSPNPYALLREAARVIAPSGHLLIAAFNPYHFARLHLAFNNHTSPKRFISRGRLQSWLELLEFTCEKISPQQQVKQTLQPSYIIAARKQVYSGVGRCITTVKHDDIRPAVAGATRQKLPLQRDTNEES